jgi:coatomer subunit beta
VFNLLTKSSNSVAYEGANTLCALFPSPTAIRAAVGTYCKVSRYIFFFLSFCCCSNFTAHSLSPFFQLMIDESDPNIKLIILGRLTSLKKRHEKILQEMLMDILRALSIPNMELRRRTLQLAMELVSSRNVEDVRLFFFCILCFILLLCVSFLSFSFVALL